MIIINIISGYFFHLAASFSLFAHRIDLGIKVLVAEVLRCLTLPSQKEFSLSAAPPPLANNSPAGLPITPRGHKMPLPSDIGSHGQMCHMQASRLSQSWDVWYTSHLVTVQLNLCSIRSVWMSVKGFDTSTMGVDFVVTRVLAQSSCWGKNWRNRLFAY